MSGEPLQIPPPGFESLSIDEQLEYVERLWEHIAAHPERVPVPDWHRRIIQERLQSDSSSRPWTEVREDLRKKFGSNRG